MSSASTLGHTSPTILIVEDTEDTRDLWVLVFQDAGFRVLVASSMAEGLASLRADARIDVVLTDFGLPDGTGDELLGAAALEGTLRDARALLCTANRGVVKSPHARVVHKPILPDDLLMEVRELLASSRSEVA